MEKIIFDGGIKEYQIGDGDILRFNPSDPNVYARFVEAADKFSRLEADLVAKAQAANGSGEEALKILTDADKEAKQILAGVFGVHNDFDQILRGVNLLAVASNGERVLTNLIVALQPVLQQGAEACARQQANAAKAQADAARKKRKG